MDWIHCNTCFESFDQPNVNSTKKQFYITGCGSIFCKKCGYFADGTSDCCKGCKNKCSSTLIGGKSFQMNPQVLKYFQDPVEDYEKLFKVMQFQKEHRMKLIGHNHYLKSKYNRAKVYIKKLENELMIAKNALLNTSKKQDQSLISNSKINADSTFHTTVPNMRYRKQSFQNEFSTLSSKSMGSEVSSAGSSLYAHPLQESPDGNYIQKIDNLHLNAFRMTRRF